MCFTIAKPESGERENRWAKKRIVFKVFRLTVKRKQLWSPFYPRLYKLGEVKVRSEGETSCTDQWSGRQKAVHGIYAYDTKTMALAEAKNRASQSRAKFVVVRCAVKPADLLHVSCRLSIWSIRDYAFGHAATYEQIKPLRIVK